MPVSRAHHHNERTTIAAAAGALLIGSIAAIAFAPMLMPESYSVVENAVSESAAQGVEGAWLARTGFLLLGFAVLLLASIAGERWGVYGRAIHRVYGVSMIAAAAFSHMPWEDVPYVVFEDTLHSWAAGAVGFSFIAGVMIVSFRQGPELTPTRIFDAIAVVAALGISMTMFAVPEIAGLIQRVMFGIGYLWYGMEAIGMAQTRGPAKSPAQAEPEVLVSH